MAKALRCSQQCLADMMHHQLWDDAWGVHLVKVELSRLPRICCSSTDLQGTKCCLLWGTVMQPEQVLTGLLHHALRSETVTVLAAAK